MKTSAKLSIGSEILISRLTARPCPFFVQYCLLNACNARCVYCNYPQRDEASLTLEQHYSVLAGFAKLGSRRIKFLGGEPLLSDQIGPLLDETRRLGMRTALVTNGF